MEANNNSFDSSAIVKELQTLNESVISNNQKLDILQEYLITQDKQRREAEQLQAEQDGEKAVEDAKANSQANAEQEQSEQTYTELLTSINDNLELSNSIQAGQIFFTGIIAGILIGLILWQRFINRL